MLPVSEQVLLGAGGQLAQGFRQLASLPGLHLLAFPFVLTVL